MTCTIVFGGVICTNTNHYKLRISDGRRVFIEWHEHCGPVVYVDKAMNRELENWWEDNLVCSAINWFVGRGCKA